MKKPSSFSVADRSGSSTIGPECDHRGIGQAFDDRLEQVGLGSEVVIEGAPRRIELVEHVLDAHLLVALGLDQALGDVDEGIAANGVDGGVDGCEPWLRY